MEQHNMDLLKYENSLQNANSPAEMFIISNNQVRTLSNECIALIQENRDLKLMK